MATFEVSETALRIAAQRAYEGGRFRGALLRGAAAATLALPSYLACNRSPVAATCLVGLALLMAASYFRGERYQEGARAGLIAGILPCLFPSALRLVYPDLCDALFARGPWLCAMVGVAAGAILGLRSRAVRGLPFWVGALVALGLAATLGCIPAGRMGSLGLLLGVVAGGAPMLALRRSSA